ncbi:alpha-hydroxy acid oxidase [Amycolatopsis sp. YIM 10]|uniref:alpha-hydroxy acid oxidase n=1 Tax=Amycolatopsis sp. YIM 10 TaxID=2653857 RepID=UPI00128FF202|nr:alpha-hydroxy acid oxidase [Amycolatopsis sp. YIM 10]QFU91960.1 (S)-mandelate dehydrogenase [Amycolatopsis sp. YIM 10]
MSQFPADPRRRIPRWSDVEPFLRRPSRTGARPDAVDRRLARCVTIGDLEKRAKRRVPAPVWDYVHTGAEEEVTLRRNREAFERVEFSPRAFEQVGDPDLSTTILGRPAASPLFLAPTGYSRLSHHSGEIAVAAAAAAAGVPYTLSTYATTSIADVAAVGGRNWFQFYVMRDRAVSREHAEEARRHGYEAAVLTIDTAITGLKASDLRNGFSVPPRLTARSLAGFARRPAWVANTLTTGPLRFATFPPGSEYGVWGASNHLREPRLRPADVAWLKQLWGGPVVVKGVLSVADAIAAVDAGADAVQLSNHGGRQLDRSPVPLELLPRVVDAIGDRAEVYLDSGVRSGADVVAALGFGARAVGIGRPYLYGLMVGGRRGVDRCLDILTSDMRRTMTLLGTADVGAIGGQHVGFVPHGSYARVPPSR